MSETDPIRKFVLKRAMRPIKGSELTSRTRLFEECVLDSFAMLELVAYVEETFQISLKNNDIRPEHFQSIQAIHGLIQAKKDSKG